MDSKVDWRRVFIFLAFAFGIAWLVALVIALTGGLQNSVQIAPNITLALILLAAPYMWAPALANILTRTLTHEGWHDSRLRPNFRKSWPYWLAAWVLPAVMTIAGAALFFLIFPQHFDGQLSKVQESLKALPAQAGFTPWMIVLIQTLAAIAIAPLLNSLATFGEEFGWRAYLMPKLLPLGWRKAMLLMGVIWGVWHWPVIFMGYEYGLNYPGYPWLGPILFIWFTFLSGTFLGWAALRGGSVWPAVIGHAAMNGIAGIAALAVLGAPNPLLGPLPVGIIGAAGYALVGLILFFSNPALPEQPPTSQPVETEISM